MGSADFILHSTYLHNFRPEGLPPPPRALIGKLGLAWGVALGARFLPGSRILRWFGGCGGGGQLYTLYRRFPIILGLRGGQSDCEMAHVRGE